MARKKHNCACGMSDIGYTRKRKKRTTRRLHDIGSMGAHRGASCRIIQTPGGPRRGCYNAKGQFRFKKMSA